MPTKWSQTLIPTARQVPSEAEVPSHQLMLRAGYIHKLGAGIYDYLPLGLRSLRKAMDIVRQEMDRVGAIEVMLPTLQPIELWEQTGRRAAYGENLFVVKDRHGREQALGPTHEEVITHLVASCIESYRQLPVTLYQIQTKFRDEFRPRFGVLRSREFQMKDAYSFHLSLDGPGGLEETYQKQYEAYRRIFERCGLPYEIVEAESGPIGGSASHEFMVPSPTGEDVILKSDKGNYAANVEKCEIGGRPHSLDGPSTGDLEKVHTPDSPGIDDVVAFFKKQLKTKLKPQNMLKTLVFTGLAVPNQLAEKIMREHDWKTKLGDIKDQLVVQWVLAVVRGDHEVNEAKVLQLAKKWWPGLIKLELADDSAVREQDITFGYVSPRIVLDTPGLMRLAIDPDAAQEQFWVTGGDDEGYHVKHFNWKRDVLDLMDDRYKQHVTVADIRNATDGDPSPKADCGVLQATKGIEIGHVFKLGCKYAESLNLTVLDEANKRVYPIMGCYGIGVNRILAAAIEREGGNDENGIIWPASIAPYSVLITPIKYEGAMRDTADRLAGELEAAGLDTLIDDRDERPGVKFKDADLIGIPLRVTIGEKALANGQVEVKPRHAKQAELVAVDQAAKHIAGMLQPL